MADMLNNFISKIILPYDFFKLCTTCVPGNATVKCITIIIGAPERNGKSFQ